MKSRNISVHRGRHAQFKLQRNIKNAQICNAPFPGTRQNIQNILALHGGSRVTNDTNGKAIPSIRCFFLCCQGWRWNRYRLRSTWVCTMRFPDWGWIYCNSPLRSSLCGVIGTFPVAWCRPALNNLNSGRLLGQQFLVLADLWKVALWIKEKNEETGECEP